MCLSFPIGLCLHQAHWSLLVFWCLCNSFLDMSLCNGGTTTTPASREDREHMCIPQNTRALRLSSGDVHCCRCVAAVMSTTYCDCWVLSFLLTHVFNNTYYHLSSSSCSCRVTVKVLGLFHFWPLSCLSLSPTCHVCACSCLVVQTPKLKTPKG